MSDVKTALRGMVHKAIRALYWMSGANAEDPVMQDGVQRAWTDGFVHGNPQYADERNRLNTETQRRRMS